MITCHQQADTGFVEIDWAADLAPLYGARVSYSLDAGRTYAPCAMYRGLDADSLLECSFWDWNQGVQHGSLRFDGPSHPVFWNLYLNRLHAHRGPVRLRVETLGADGLRTHDVALELTPGRAVYLDDWPRWAATASGWRTDGGRLTLADGQSPAPLRVQPGLTGSYVVYVGIPHGTLLTHLRASNEEFRYPFSAERTRAEFQEKCHKELCWKTVELQPDTVIEISPYPVSLRQPRVWPFGSVGYLKLVPAPRPAPKRHCLRGADRKLALYFEPYSWAFFYNLDTPAQVREALGLLREMGADEIHTQVIRFGSQSLHHGRVAERHDRGALMGDDGTFSPGPTAMVKALDVLRVAIDTCREWGLTHYANAALTNCYPGTDFEDRISREHPEWRANGNSLLYRIPQVRAHAAAIVREFVEWGTDGVSIDCLRYPQHQSEEDLVLLFHELHAAIRAQAGARTVPVTARIPAGDVVYYRAFDQLVREGLVHTVIPSNYFMRAPRISLKPYRKWRDHGCRVFGLIDGWDSYFASFHDFQLSLFMYPSAVREDIARFLREGADGIFVYQADNYCADPLLRTVLDWRRRPA